MSVAIQIKPERRQYNQHLVEELQEERHQVWELYCKVADLKPFNHLPETQSLLNQFSQILIDYVSLGHFGVFERLLNGTERRESVLTEANKIYPEFSQTTEAVISFNDKYDSQKHKLSTDKLESDLSSLGEYLAKRIDLEDKLCHLVLQSTQ